MQEQWAQWEPLLGLTKKYNIESITDNITSLEIIFISQAKDHSLIMIFQVSSGSYQITNEEYYFEWISKLSAISEEWIFYKINHSHYLKILSEQSDTISDTRNFIHFSILLPKYRLDVMAPFEPVVKKYNLT